MILASFGLFVAIGKAFQTWALSQSQHPVGNNLSIAVGNGFPVALGNDVGICVALGNGLGLIVALGNALGLFVALGNARGLLVAIGDDLSAMSTSTRPTMETASISSSSSS
jgi:hypothetical protein